MIRKHSLSLVVLLIGLILACTITHSYAQDESSSTGEEVIEESSTADGIIPAASSTGITGNIFSSSSFNGSLSNSSTGIFINCTLTPNITECLINCTLTPTIQECTNCTINPTLPQCIVNCTLTPDDPTCFQPVPVPPTNQQILANASCPIYNYRADDVSLSSPHNSQWCIAGQTDDTYHCGTPMDCALGNQVEINKVAQGIQQDSLYSTNPPGWWRCLYTKVTYVDIPGNETLGTNTTTEVIEESKLVTVVSGNCFSDSTQCTPLRYMSNVNQLNENGTATWVGQLFPPYKRLARPPIAVVIANAAFVNMSLFYPYVDVLQLLQLQGSGNETFLSLSVSTRIVVEIPGNVISNSRTRLSPTCDYVVPFFTLIVEMSGGYPSSAQWEDDCSTCTSESFVYSDDGSCNCGVPTWSCFDYVNATNPSAPLTNTTKYISHSVDCDMKIYIAYKGTDSDGNAMTSSSRTLKNFRKWSFGSLYNNIVSTYNNLPDVGNVLGCKHQTPEPGSICLDD